MWGKRTENIGFWKENNNYFITGIKSSQLGNLLETCKAFPLQKTISIHSIILEWR